MTSDLTQSQQKALREIIAYVRRERVPAGTHLPEWTLAKLIGTSRSPVRVALDRLVEAGVMRYDKNRGYSVEASFDKLPAELLEQVNSADDPLYLRLADARFRGAIPESVTEADLTRLLDASRSDVRKVLVRAQSEGWVEKEAGYGWRFLPMIDSLDAYDDMYSLRAAIEPAGILSPKFRPNLDELRELRREQQSILDGGHEAMTPTERYESNARLHETIASWSQNRLALQTLRRLDQMRRLAEYRQAKQQLPRRALAQEHIDILNAIERGDFLEAASLMRRHIEAARSKKAVLEVFNRSEEPHSTGPATAETSVRVKEEV
ncbi:GntR family transcriptional regulator [Caballeronia pedi]|uniref:GntR family transcriptional regulator n=1 Tax=Caballeronia pedi TaxID=1777141 RepID=A0A158D3Q8_9BURK|nr:GntR family transcriptional regulator [Caballeronia pedi]SAK89272.1 GntR family transcriptional regulator [Caballeronia pedi]